MNAGPGLRGGGTASQPRTGRSRLFARLAVHDVRLLWRYGIAAATAFVTGMWLLALTQVPDAVRPVAATWVILIDSAIVGLFFVGVLVLFERDEATLDALAVAPVGPGLRIGARVTVLTGLSLAASLVIRTVSATGTGPQLALTPLVVGVALLSSVATLNAIVIAAPFRTFSDYVTLAPLGFLPLSLPLVVRAVGLEGTWWHLVPGYGPVDLVLGAGTGMTAARFALSAASGLVWTAVMAAAAWWAFRRWFLSASVPPLAHTLGVRAARVTGVARDSRPATAGNGARARASRRAPAAGSGFSWVVVVRMLRQDVRLVRREPMTALLLVAPVLLTAAVAFGLAPLLEMVDGRGVDAGAFRSVAVGIVGVVVPAVLGGSAVALLLLGDRDGGTLLALRVTPLRLRGYLAYRGVVAGLFGGVTAAAVLLAARVSPAALFAVPLTASAAAVTAFTVAAVARNKVEALAMVKVVSLLWLLPAIVLMMSSPSFDHRAGFVALAVVPTWWPLQTLAAGMAGDPVLPHLLTGFLATTALVVASWMVAVRRLVR